MKTLLIGILLLSVKAFSIPVWVDGNNIEWTLLEVKTSYWRAVDRCRLLGYQMPWPDDVLEALDYGMANPKKNTAFGDKMRAVDWMWTSETFTVISSYVTIVSRWRDTAQDHETERHWAVCGRRVYRLR